MSFFGMISVVAVAIAWANVYGNPNPNTDPVNVLDTSLRELHERLEESLDAEEHRAILAEISNVHTKLVDLEYKLMQDIK